MDRSQFSHIEPWSIPRLPPHGRREMLGKAECGLESIFISVCMTRGLTLESRSQSPGRLSLAIAEHSCSGSNANRLDCLCTLAKKATQGQPSVPSPRLPAEHGQGAGGSRGPKSLTALSLLLAEPKSQGPVPALCPLSMGHSQHGGVVTGGLWTWSPPGTLWATGPTGASRGCRTERRANVGTGGNHSAPRILGQ